MSASEVMVRMGEHAVSADPAGVLVSIGLGSCIGLALVDRRSALAGLAHIMLPEAGRGARDTSKFADLAVPRMLEDLTALGVVRARLEAVLVGGAQMFSLGSGAGMDIGARNEAATLAALKDAGIEVRATATGGSKGRTVRVYVADGLVTMKEAGGRDEPLLPPRDKTVAIHA